MTERQKYLKFLLELASQEYQRDAQELLNSSFVRG